MGGIEESPMGGIEESPMGGIEESAIIACGAAIARSRGWLSALSGVAMLLPMRLHRRLIAGVAGPEAG